MDLEKLKALCEAATPGPWINRRHAAGLRSIYALAEGGSIAKVARWVGGEQVADEDEANADLIAAARTAVPELIARIEELERELGQILPYAESAWDAIQRIKAAVDGDFRYLTRLHALRLERELAAIMDVLIKEADRG